MGDLTHGQCAVIQSSHDDHIGAGFLDVGHDVFTSGLRGRSRSGLAGLQHGRIVV